MRDCPRKSKYTRPCTAGVRRIRASTASRRPRRHGAVCWYCTARLSCNLFLIVGCGPTEFAQRGPGHRTQLPKSFLNGISGKWLGGRTTVLIVRTERFGTRYFLQRVTATDRLERTAHHPRCRWFSDRGLAPRQTRALPSADRAAAPASRSFLRCSAARNKFCSPRRSAW